MISANSARLNNNIFFLILNSNNEFRRPTKAANQTWSFGQGFGLSVPKRFVFLLAHWHSPNSLPAIPQQLVCNLTTACPNPTTACPNPPTTCPNPPNSLSQSPQQLVPIPQQLACNPPIACPNPPNSLSAIPQHLAYNPTTVTACPNPPACCAAAAACLLFLQLVNNDYHQQLVVRSDL